MNFIKTVFAFIVGFIATYLCYLYVNIPIAPCMTVYLVTFLFNSNNFLKLRRAFVLITGIWGIFLFGFGALYSIIEYPNYMSILGIVFSLITTFSYVGATIVCFAGITSTIQNKR